MPQKQNGPRASAGPKYCRRSKNNRFEEAIAISVWRIVAKESRVRFADLRARAGDWATRTQVIRAVNTLVEAAALVISAEIDGPVVEIVKRGAR